MSLREIMSFFGLRDREPEPQPDAIQRRRETLATLSDEELRSAAKSARAQPEMCEVFALAAAVAERVLGLRMFDTQIVGALALEGGLIAA